MTKIYTRGGDKGKTSLFNGQRVSKRSTSIEAVGAVDECNSALGCALSQLPEGENFDTFREQLISIQHALFDLGAAIATPRTVSNEDKISKTRFDGGATKQLEEWIDSIESELPPLTTFILPGGHPAGASLHLARSLSRRAERKAVPCFENDDVDADILIYLNRLSDYLFVLSRAVNHRANVPETTWVHHLN